jgi:hypothetical protein
MEIMCDYFDAGYEVLYNYGNDDIRNGEQLLNYIEGLVEKGNKVLVAVDNAHDKKTASIFYVIDHISEYSLKENVRFIITARLPEFDYFIDDLKELPQGIRESISIEMC